MKKTTLASAIIAAAMLAGCNSGGSTTYRDTPDNNKNTTVYSGGGDVDISDIQVGDGATYVNNGDGTITFIGGDTGADNTIEVDGSHGGSGPKSTSTAYDPANYDPSLSQDECNDLGFFYCTAEGKCLNRPAADGVCPAK